MKLRNEYNANTSYEYQCGGVEDREGIGLVLQGSGFVEQ